MNINFDETFLKKVRNKLAIGNTRSVHLNSLPGRYATRLDLYNLTDIKSSYPRDFVSTILSNPNFSFDITFSNLNSELLDEDQKTKIGLIAKRLNSLFYENNDNYLEYGIKTFGFGFPLLIKRDKQNSSSIIAAPILIWNLDLIKSSSIANKWTIKREEDFPVNINEVLISHIQKDENISLNKISVEYLEDAIIDGQELNQICSEIFNQLGIEREVLYTDVQKCVTSRTELKALTQDKPWILWSGIFGLYRSQKESIIRELDKLIEEPGQLRPTNLKMEHYITNSVSAVETDPSQVGILNSLQTKNTVIIQGPPGCGKSQSLTALISNALVEKKKCLVVCEKKTALDVIQQNLEKIGLGELCAVIDDVYKDRQAVVKNIRGKFEQLTGSVTVSSGDYDYYLEEVNGFREKINKYHTEFAETIFGNKNWTDTVALYLKIFRSNSNNSLNKILSPEDFKFNFDEFKRYDSVLRIALEKFKPIKSLKNPLILLSDKILSSGKSYVEVRQLIVDKISKTKDLISQINYKLVDLENDYARRIDFYYTDVKKNIDQHISSLHDDIVKYLRESKLFNKRDIFSKLTLGLFAIFSKKYKDILRKKKQLVQEFREFLKKLKKLNEFDYNINLYNNLEDYALIAKELENFNSIFKKWWLNISEEKKSYLKKYQQFELKKEIEFQSILSSSIDQINDHFNSIIQLELFAENIAPDEDLTNDSLKEILSSQLSYLQAIESNLDLLRDFLIWYEYFISLSDLEQKFITSIIETQDSDLLNTFKCWYLFWLLAKHEKGKPRNDFEIKSLLSSEFNLKNSQINNTLNHWRTQQQVSYSIFRQSGIPVRTLYNLKGSRGNKRNSLRKIIATNFDLFSDFFPVILTNPVACSSIIPLTPQLFDFVIFDEASQLRIEDTFTSLIRGRFKIVSGDKHQMPPSNYFGPKIQIDEDVEMDESDDEENAFKTEDVFIALAESESLLKFAEDSEFVSSSLDFHYRSRHPHLINFSNAAFYGTRLIPMPPRVKDKPIRFIEVNGIYERKKSTNYAEAVRVIDLLSELVPKIQTGEIKSIGVATLNMFQRNLILELIRERGESDRNFANVIDRLTSGKNFFVKNLENIQGDEKDIIIISTTFGLTNEGSFIQNFGPINQEKGYKLLNVIITRAKFQLIVCTSIPSEFYMKYAEEIETRGNIGKGIFYAYLAYARSVEENNEETRLSILNLLRRKCSDTFFQQSSGLVESPFEQEVYDYLSHHIDKNRISIQYECGGFRIDLVIKSVNNSPDIAIECDGAKYHSSPEAYSWDLFRQKRLEEHGFVFYRIWSANWWDNPELETKRLVEFVNKMDSNPKYN